MSDDTPIRSPSQSEIKEDERESRRQNCAPYLRALTAHVDELVTTRRTMARFRLMVRDCEAAHNAKSRRTRRSTPVRLLPARAMTIAEKYTTLAAIHDALCEGTLFIHPWKTPRVADLGRLERRLTMNYADRRDQVERLSESDRPYIERLLDDVAADLRKLGLLATQSVSVKPTPIVDISSAMKPKSKRGRKPRTQKDRDRDKFLIDLWIKHGDGKALKAFEKTTIAKKHGWTKLAYKAAAARERYYVNKIN